MSATAKQSEKTPARFMARREWDKLPISAQREYFLNGGRFAQEVEKVPDGVITRAEWDTFSNNAKWAFIRGGGRLKD